jgi:hypothetical protein
MPLTEETTYWLHHPELGELPAQVLIDCIFALAPNGRILHFHIEEMETENRPNEHHFSPNGDEPAPERSRCQVIPPFVTVFSKRA